MMRAAVAAAALAGCVAQGRAAPNDSPFDAAWARDALWDDGLAEVSLYDARRPQYGKIEAYQALLIVVKEDLTSDGVKADPPYEGRSLTPVLKLNAVHGYWTDNYPYHLLVSAFVRREDPRTLLKISAGRQEWCGNTFQLLDWRAARPRLRWHSYFEKFSDGERELAMARGDLAEDQLPLALRGLRSASGARIETKVLPSLISADFRDRAVPRAARIEVGGLERVKTGLGERVAWRVDVSWEGMRQTWWFAGARPHALLKMEASDGRSLVLHEQVRKAYWDAPTFRPAE